MKLLWKLVKDNNSMWVKLVKNKYFKNKSLFEYKPSVVASWQWRQLMRLRDTFKKGLRWQIGSGDQISFWFDIWVFQFPLKAVVHRASYPIDFKVSDCFLENRQWNMALLRELVPEHIVSAISSLFIPMSVHRDKLVWGLSPDGEYSVKTGALLAQGLLPSPPENVEFRWIWTLDVVPKIKNFLWKLCNDGLPTKDRLEKSHVFLPQQCVLCTSHCETATHLFMLCPFVTDVFLHLQASEGWPCLPVLTNVSASSSFLEVLV